MWNQDEFLPKRQKGNISRFTGVFAYRLKDWRIDRIDYTKLKLISGNYGKYEFSSDGRFHLSGNEIVPHEEIRSQVYLHID